MKKRLPQNLINILVEKPYADSPLILPTLTEDELYFLKEFDLQYLAESPVILPWAELNEDLRYYKALIGLTKTGEIDAEDLPPTPNSSDYQ